MDAGGLAQMTYQPNPFDNGRHLATPNTGFASRNKAAHAKRLSVALPPKITTIDETQQIDVGATPRTSRGHLLAGLRTAPKSATLPSGQVAPGLESSRYADVNQSNRTPQTATGAYFPARDQSTSLNSGRQMYSLPEHVLAPPQIEIEAEGDHMDKQYYNELVATNAYLAQQQRALQQQLMDVQAAAHQFSGMNMNMQSPASQRLQSPNMTLYNQQLQQGMQPIVQPVPSNPGVYQVYNPMTGQTNLVVDNSAQQQATQQEQQHSSNERAEVAQSPSPPMSGRRPRMSPPSVESSRARSPPKSLSTPPQEVEPLPPPSANAFRRGHNKSSSSFSAIRTDIPVGSAGLKSGAMPPTPLSGALAPGSGQPGVKPIRQPRNPINVNELVEAPTSKHTGSKNFVARQRRRAVQDLVKARRDRGNDGRPQGSETGTPGSEAEYDFSVASSENDDNSVPPSSSNLSRKTSAGALNTTPIGAIGSERKEKSREREAADPTAPAPCTYSSMCLSNGDGSGVGGSSNESEPGRRKTPMLVLSSAEKRKSLAAA